MSRSLILILVILSNLAAKAQNTVYSVGKIDMEFNVGGLGNAEVSIPIDIPDVASELKPAISLNYSSLNGHGILGLGFQLSGFSSITRTNKNLYFDGETSNIDFSNDGEFLLDGKRLIRIAANEYLLENDLTAKISFNETANSFKLTKDGKTYYYGQDGLSRIKAGNNTATWNLSRVEDSHGNFIAFNYYETDFLTQPHYIFYSDPNYKRHCTVTFKYEEMPDDVQGSFYGFRRSFCERISQIVVSSYDQEVYTYKLSYIDDDCYSRLSTIYKTNSQGDSLPPITIKWNTIDDIVEARETNIINYSASDVSDIVDFWNQQVVSGDFNGDGLDDLVLIAPQQNSTYNKILFYKAVKNGLNVSFSFVGNFFVDGNFSFDILSNRTTFCFGDFDGNGTNELIIPILKILDGYFQHIGFAFCEDLQEKPSRTYNLTGKEMPEIVFADFLNNGKTQIFYIETVKNEAGNYPAKLVSADGDSDFQFSLKEKTKEIFASDFNGDNSVDIILFGEKGYTILFNDGKGFFSDQSKMEVTDLLDGYYILHNGDFNGDGLMDFVYTRTNDENWYFLTNRGNGNLYKHEACTSNLYDRDFTTNDNNHFDFKVLDFNCDGKSDIVIKRGQYYKEKSWGVYEYTQTDWLKSNGMQLILSGSSVSLNERDSWINNFTTGDFNGDGVQELISYGYNCRYNNKSTEDPQWRIYYNTDITSGTNKISSISDSYSTIDIRYTLLTDSTFYYKGVGHSYPIIDVVMPMAVVSATIENNGITSPTTKLYSYQNLTANVQGKGLIGFDKIVCSDEGKGETITNEVLEWNTVFYTPAKTKQTVTNGSQTTYSETVYEIIPKGGKNYVSFPIRTKSTDIYGDTTLTTNVFNTEYGYLDSTKTEYQGGYYKLTKYEDYVCTGGLWQPQTITKAQKVPQDDKPYCTQTHYQYDYKGAMQTKTDNYLTSKKVVTEYKYNDAGNIVHTEVYDNLTQKFITDYTYDEETLYLVRESKNYPTRVTDYEYDNFGNIISTTDISDTLHPQKTIFEHDGWGNEVLQKNPDGTSVSTTTGWGSDKEHFYYVLTESSAAPWKKEWYDVLGRITLTETVAEGGLVVKTFNYYDDYSNLIKTKTLIGGIEYIESYSYDNLNRVISHTDSKGLTTEYSYSKHKVVSSCGNRLSQKTYDVFDNVLTAKDEVSLIEYTYKSNCKPATIKAAGACYSFEYDETGNRISMTDPDAGETKYEYDVFQNLVKQQDAEGNIIEFRYKNGLLNRMACGVTICDYKYDDFGKLLKEQKALISTQYTYDSLNRISSEIYDIEGKQFTYHYTYNKYGLVESKSFPDSTTEHYKYDSYGNINEILLNDTVVWKLTECGVLNRKATILEKYTVSHDFDKNSYPVSTTLSYNGGVLHKMTYEFDTHTGNLLSRNGMYPETEYFAYDNADRLKQITRNQETTEIEYAENGNITYKTGLGHYSYLPKRPHTLESVDNTDTIIKNSLQDITYTDLNKANTITQYFDDYSYCSMSFSYGPDNVRRKTEFVKDNAKTDKFFLPDYEEIHENGNIKKIHYVNSPDGLVGCYTTQQHEEGVFQVAFTDHLGSITRLYEKDSAVFAATYDAFGNRTITSGDTTFARGYCGVHQHYPLFDIIDMGGRMYDPIVGRFLSPDPYIQEWDNSQNFNRYSYCLNNPLKYTDPSGEFIWWPLISSTLFNAFLGGTLSSLDGKSFWSGAVRGIISGACSASVGYGMDVLTKGFIAVGAIPGAVSRGIIDGVSGGIAGGLSNMIMGDSFGYGFMVSGVSSFAVGVIKGSISGYRMANKLIGGDWEGNPITGNIVFDKTTVYLDYKNVGAIQKDKTKHCYAYVLEYADYGHSNKPASFFISMADEADGYDAITIASKPGSGMSANRFMKNISSWESSLQTNLSGTTIIAITSNEGTNHWVAVTGATFANKVRIFGGQNNRYFRVLLSSDIWDPISGHRTNFTGGLSHMGIIIPK